MGGSIWSSAVDVDILEVALTRSLAALMRMATPVHGLYGFRFFHGGWVSGDIMKTIDCLE